MCRIVSKLFCGMLSKLEFRVIVRIVPRRNVQSWNLLQVHIRWWYLCFHEYQAREKHKQNRDTHLGKKRNERWRILYGRFRLTTTLVVSGRFSEDCPKYKARCLIWECFVYRWYNVGKNHLHQKNEIWHTCMWSLFFAEHFKFCLIYIMVPCIIILMLH